MFYMSLTFESTASLNLPNSYEKGVIDQIAIDEPKGKVNRIYSDFNSNLIKL